MTGIPPAPRGVPQIEVSFDIDVNGILHVKAKDKATNKENKVEIKGHSGLSKEEIERMKKEAEAHAAEDKTRREMVDLRNRAEAVVFQVERELQEHGGKVGPQERSDIEAALNQAKEAMKTEDKGAIEKAMENLNRARMKLGEAIYKATAGAAAGAPGAGAAAAAEPPAGAEPPPSGAAEKKGPDDVIDAEYELK